LKAELFEIAIPEADLEELRIRLARTRWADDLGNEDWRYGVERCWLEDMIRYWREDYVWRAQEREMNRFPHFRVTIDGVPLHFLHVRGKGANPMPLLLIHGWPWTFMDFHAVIGPLTDPAAHRGDGADAFDLIIPSLPGFGFSMPLTTTGLDGERTAELLWRLMTEVLGLSRFAVAGGDFGAMLSGQIAHAHPEQVVGVLATIPLIPGLLDLAAFKPEDYDTDEQWMLTRKAEIARSGVSHLAAHSNDPQTLAYALVESPVGTAAWLWERRRAWSDCGGDLLSIHDRDFLCTLASIYWLTRTIGTSLRIYWEQHNSHMFNRRLHQRKPVIEVPTAYAIHPKEVVLVPRSVVAANTNLQRWTVMPRGGHFGFAEQPAGLTNELRTFFRPLRSVG
jgi:pimeloyl-ACP methyl ester carboxylesterase